MLRSTRDRLAGASSLGALRAVLSSAIAITLPACAHDRALAPSPPDVSVSHSVVQASHASGLGDALSDASTRLAGSVGDAVARAQLNGYLLDLSAQLDAGDIGRARSALALARKALAANLSAKGVEPADLAAIGLALDQVESVLNADGTAVQP
jgi:hypothetical protein